MEIYILNWILMEAWLFSGACYGAPVLHVCGCKSSSMPGEFLSVILPRGRIKPEPYGQSLFSADLGPKSVQC